MSRNDPMFRKVQTELPAWKSDGGEAAASMIVTIREAMSSLTDSRYQPNCRHVVVLVMGNLNTHDASPFYERFPLERARGYVGRLETRFTPKHGSWLDVAEIELAALTAQCFKNRRIGSVEELRRETSAWEGSRNEKQKGVDWQFTTIEARTRLKHLCPIVNMGDGESKSAK